VALLVALLLLLLLKTHGLLVATSAVYNQINPMRRAGAIALARSFFGYARLWRALQCPEHCLNSTPEACVPLVP